jgi:hypothetical protein
MASPRITQEEAVSTILAVQVLCRWLTTGKLTPEKILEARGLMRTYIPRLELVKDYLGECVYEPKSPTK